MKQIIPYEKLILKRQSGQEKTKCPNCSESRTNKHDKSFSYNHEAGVGHCHYCSAISIKEKKDFTPIKTYNLPNQDWQNHTNLSDKLIKWIASERKIRQETLIKFGVTEEVYYQPSHSKEVNNIVFNYFEGDKIVNKKYRSGDKMFTQTSGGKPILYNINSAIGANEVWIVEGEFDALALSEAGIENVVSIPNGANDSDDYWRNSEPYLRDVSLFVIATDNDEKGIDVRDRIAQRLGRYRCSYIEFNGKDANEDLVSGVLSETIKNKKKFPVSGTLTMKDVSDSLLSLYDNGLPETISPKKECFGDFRQKFSLMKGHLCVTTGIPSHGKSTFSEWYLLNLVHERNFKVSFFSPEHRPIQLHASNLARLAVGKGFFGNNRMSKQDVERFVEWSNEKIYFTSPDGGEAANWDWILETFKEQMVTFGVDVFVVDAFNKVLLPKSSNKKDEIDTILTKLTAFAQSNNVIIYLVAHPTKMQKDSDGIYGKPTLYDVSGSADFRNQAHDGLCVYRHFPSERTEGFTEVINLKTKYSFQGEIGASTTFDYHLESGRYFAQGYPKYLDDMTKEKTEQIPIGFMSELHDYDDEDDNPF